MLSRMVLPRSPIGLQRASAGSRQHAVELTLSERYSIPMGLVKDWQVYSLAGCRLAIAVSKAVLWPGTALIPAWSDTPGTITIQSSSASDGASGSGASMVLVEYIDDDGWGRFGVGQLPGLAATPANVIQWQRNGDGPAGPVTGNPVASGTRINRMIVMTLGSAAPGTFFDSNIGTLSGMAGGTEVSAVEVAAGLSSCSCFTTPRGFFSQLEAIAVAASATDKTLSKIWIKGFGAPILDFATLQTGTEPLPTPTPFAVTLPPRSDFLITVERTSGGTTDASSAFHTARIPDPDDMDPSPDLQAPSAP